MKEMKKTAVLGKYTELLPVNMVIAEGMWFRLVGGIDYADWIGLCMTTEYGLLSSCCDT